MEPTDTSGTPKSTPTRPRRLFRRDERGANLVEYTLLIALIVLACLAGVTAFGKKVPAEGFASISSSI